MRTITTSTSSNLGFFRPAFRKNKQGAAPPTNRQPTAAAAVLLHGPASELHESLLYLLSA
jgi:hypothetical protein